MKSPRRNFLRAVGVAVALPLLDSLVPRGVRAAAAGSAVRRMVCINTPLGLHPANFFPKAAGRDYVRADDEDSGDSPPRTSASRATTGAAVVGVVSAAHEGHQIVSAPALGVSKPIPQRLVECLLERLPLESRLAPNRVL